MRERPDRLRDRAEGGRRRRRGTRGGRGADVARRRPRGARRADGPRLDPRRPVRRLHGCGATVRARGRRGRPTAGPRDLRIAWLSGSAHLCDTRQRRICGLRRAPRRPRRRRAAHAWDHRRVGPHLPFGHAHPAHLRLAPGPVVPRRGPPRRAGGVRRPPDRDRRGRAGRPRGRRGRRLRPGAAARRRGASWPTTRSTGSARLARPGGDHQRQPRLRAGGSASRAGWSTAPACTCAPTPAGVDEPGAARRRRTARSRSTASPTSSPTCSARRGAADRGRTSAVLGAAMDRVRADLAGRPAAPARWCWPTRSSPGGLPSDSERDISVGGVSGGARSSSSTASTTPRSATCTAGTTLSETVRYSGSPARLLVLRGRPRSRARGWSTSTPTGSARPTFVAAPVPRPLARLRGTLDDLLTDPASPTHEDCLGAGRPSPTTAARRRRWTRLRAPLPARPGAAASRPRARAGTAPAVRTGTGRSATTTIALDFVAPRARRAGRPPPSRDLLRDGAASAAREDPDLDAGRTRWCRLMRLHDLSITAFGPFVDTVHRRLRRARRRRALPAHRRHRRGQDQRARRRLLRALRRGARRPRSAAKHLRSDHADRAGRAARRARRSASAGARSGSPAHRVGAPQEARHRAPRMQAHVVVEEQRRRRRDWLAQPDQPARRGRPAGHRPARA